MSDPLILKRCMAALQAKYVLTDEEAKGMASIVLSVAATLWRDPPRDHNTPSPQQNVVGDLDYCFDPEDWEFTCSWSERDQVHGYGENLMPGHPMRVCTLLKGPDKWVADVPITWDEDGEPDETEIKWFDSEGEARAALATTEGKDNG